MGTRRCGTLSTASWCDVSANSREKAESHALAGLKVIEINQSGYIKVVMDAFKKEPEVDPLAIQTSDNTDLEEKKSISEEGNLLDVHVAAIKTECVDHNYDLTSEFKVEQISVGTNFIAAKCKAEEELCDLNTMKDELKLEENEILTNSFADARDGTVSSDCEEFAQEYTTSFQGAKHSVTSADAGKMRFRCDVCGRCFIQEAHLKNHALVHSNSKPFKCDVCGRCFSQSGSLTTHQLRHKGEEPFKCDECGKCFSYLCFLIKHHRRHTGDKPFKCCNCGKRFSDESNLKRHERNHIDDKSLRCEFCGKYFSHPYSFKRHQRRHTSNKPFKCGVCGKGFWDQSSLKTHVRHHTGEKPFTCEVCGKCFSVRSTLKCHERQHTGETPFKCDHCGKCFSYSRSLKRHNCHRSLK